MTLFTILLIIGVCSYCAFRTAGRMLGSDPGSVRSMSTCFWVGILSVLTALPLALIGRFMHSTLDLPHAAVIGLIAGQVAFFLRAPLNPPRRSR